MASSHTRDTPLASPDAVAESHDATRGGMGGNGNAYDGVGGGSGDGLMGERHEGEDESERVRLEKKLVRVMDWRLCTIAGVLCSLNLVDSGIIS